LGHPKAFLRGGKSRVCETGCTIPEVARQELIWMRLREPAIGACTCPMTLPTTQPTADSANFRLFGMAHLVILSSTCLLAGILAWIQRRVATDRSRLRIALGIMILLEALLWYVNLVLRHLLTFPDRLPLELCDVTLWLMVVVLFTLSPALFDFVYYGALAGSAMALLTPNLWEPFPSLSTIQFFVSHGLVVAAALYLVWSGLARPRPGSPFRALLYVNLWAAADGVFDAIFKTDYMYLRAKPANTSLLTFLGPWPWYILSAEGVALGLFVLLYLPFWRPARGKTAETGPRP
jgi:hypothetical integral membrane protein (TIGR02206 family)